MDGRSRSLPLPHAVPAFALRRRSSGISNPPGLGGGAYRSQHELILLLTKGTRSGNRRDLGDVLSFPRVMTRGHYPTEKPVALLKTLVSQSSQPGELVLDPFCGSGSTGRAARELGRRALLCDLDASTAAATLRVAFVPLESAAATRRPCISV